MLSMRNAVIALAFAAPSFAALEIQAPAMLNPAGAGNVVLSAVSSMMSIQTHTTVPGAAANAPISTASAAVSDQASSVPAAVSSGGNVMPTLSAVPGNGTDAGGNPNSVGVSPTLISVPGITSDITASASITAAPFPLSSAGGLPNSNTTMATTGLNNKNNTPSNASMTDSADAALFTATATSNDDYSNSSATTMSTSTRSSTASPSASNATKAKNSQENAAVSVSTSGRAVWTVLAVVGLTGFMLV